MLDPQRQNIKDKQGKYVIGSLVCEILRCILQLSITIYENLLHYIS